MCEEVQCASWDTDTFLTEGSARKPRAIIQLDFLLDFVMDGNSVVLPDSDRFSLSPVNFLVEQNPKLNLVLPRLFESISNES